MSGEKKGLAALLSENKKASSVDADKKVGEGNDDSIDKDDAKHMQEIVSQATEHQRVRLKAVENWWLNQKNEVAYRMTGEPGTGKTFVAAILAGSLKGALPLFTAPTNSAVGELAKSLRFTKHVPATIFSALGLGMSSRSKELQLVKMKEPKDLHKYNLIIIDEASMLDMRNPEYPNAPRQVLDYILEHAKENNVRILFLYDDCQLPPIPAKKNHKLPSGAYVSPSHPATLQGKSPVHEIGIPGIHMSEVVRHDGAILQYARRVREQIIEEQNMLFLQPNSEEIKVIGKRQVREFLLSEEMFSKVISGHTAIVSWRNAVVDELNQLVREQQHGVDTARTHSCCVGDQILFTAPLMSHDKELSKIKPDQVVDDLSILVSTNARAEITDIEMVKIWGIDCYMLNANVEGRHNVKFPVPTIKGKAVFMQLLQAVAKTAKTFQDEKNWKEKARYWEIYHGIKSVFGQLKASYALTGHRAQGCTLDTVIANYNDLSANPDKSVAKKNMYVAITRASKTLVIIRGI